jgi:16S rRNA (guanine527-N7)-methyltransferase
MFHVEQSIAFNNICSANGLRLTPEQLETFERYAGLLLEWNAKINLVSRKDEQNIWSSHFLHSISPLFGRSVPEKLRVLDIGTGGGLPGIPMAIVKSGWTVTLMDSIGKKALAVQDIVERLGMGRVDVVSGRAEDAANVGGRRGKYDLVVARGVAPLVQLAKWSKPYLMNRTTPVEETAGRILPVPSLVAYKGGDMEGELRELRVKVPGTVQWVGDLVFGGSAESGLEGKKLIILQFT